VEIPKGISGYYEKLYRELSDEMPKQFYRL